MPSALSKLNFGIEPNALASSGVTAIVALNHPRLAPSAQAVTPLFSFDKALVASYPFLLARVYLWEDVVADTANELFFVTRGFRPLLGL